MYGLVRVSLGACNPFVLEAPAAETAAGLSGEWAMRPDCALAKVQTYRGEWRAADNTAGGCTAGLYQFNPRFRISSTSENCQVYLTLSLPDLRFLVPDEVCRNRCMNSSPVQYITCHFRLGSWEPESSRCAWQDAHPELFERYGLRYPSVCVLRGRGTAEVAAGTGTKGGTSFRFENLPTDQSDDQADSASQHLCTVWTRKINV